MNQPGLEVCFSPLMLPKFELAGKIVVVIDVLRATSTMCYALNQGAKAIIPVADLAECQEYSEEYIKGAERNGQKPEGFEFGNSPFDYTRDKVESKTIVLTTTNGTKCIRASAGADQILIGSFLNLNSIAKYLKQQEQDTLLFCAGWKGHFNLEDSLFAGAVVNQLKDQFTIDQDSSLAAEQLFLTNADDLFDIIKKSSHYRRLSGLGISKDMELCMTPNLIDLVPAFVDGTIQPLH